MQATDTIAAIATPPGTGAIAVIRMSGPQAPAVLQACTGRQLEARRATLVRIRDAAGRVVDDVVATYFAAPASYTGEEVVEVSCHGGMLVTRRVLERLLELERGGEDEAAAFFRAMRDSLNDREGTD